MPSSRSARRQQISHSQLPTSPVVTAILLQAIGPGPIRRPSQPLPGLTPRRAGAGWLPPRDPESYR